MSKLQRVFYAIWLLILVLLCACQKRPLVHARTVIPRPCLVKMELTEKSECKGPDMEHMVCGNINIVAQCANLAVDK